MIRITVLLCYVLCNVSAEFLGVIRPSNITMEISVLLNGVTSYIVQDIICPCIKYAVFDAHNDLITETHRLKLNVVKVVSHAADSLLSFFTR